MLRTSSLRTPSRRQRLELETARELYEIVARFESFGDHRTGTPVDAATTAWLCAELLDRGADVVQQEWGLQRFDAAATVTVDGVAVDTFPIWYCALGDVHTDRVGRAVLAPDGPGGLAGLEQVMARAVAAGDEALVVATATDSGGLFAVNRPAGTVGTVGTVPVLCVAGDSAAALGAAAAVEVAFHAELVTAASANVVASWGGAPDVPHLVVGTPLTGWFGCAGERGSGLAVALSVATQLAQRWPVCFVGTSGHELDGLGLTHHLSTVDRSRIAAVLHVGASAAATDPRPADSVGTTRWSVTDRELAGVRDALSETGHPVFAAGEVGWRGEASAWSDLAVPLLSVAGSTPLFHTPSDRLPAATTPAILRRVRDGTLAAAQVLAANARTAAPG